MKTIKRYMAAVMALAAAVSMSSMYTANAYSSTTITNVVSTASASAVVFSVTGSAPESVYAEWGAVSGADGYNVYVKKSGGSYIQIDTMLVRQYPSCFRADAVGLSAGSYTLKAVPVIGGKEDASKAAETSAITVAAADRTGYAFQNSGKDVGKGVLGCGGYQADGTLAADAQVIYVTGKNVNTVALDVITNSKGATTACTGLANIMAARQKGYDLRPLVIRIVGEIKASEISGLNSSGYLQVKGCRNVTIEGIGKDATINGWGLLVRSTINVEIKNIGVMLFPDDGISLDTDNFNTWVHNCDIFYGTAGGDKDQAKGDGSLDCKLSTYVTFSYNHFWDSGKCNLLGLSEDTTENLFITYHHNWYDHSDSRHPRVRFYTAHVYNNYYDGNSKYGIGATMGCSIFAENNYFRNCKYPMMISLQGSDVAGSNTPTFSSENGGMIKAYGNVMEGQTGFISYADNKTDFDAYVASSKTEKVPDTVTAKQGGSKYNNFDTASAMYQWTPDAAKDVPAKVMAGAGRTQGGDFTFTFNNSVDDASYAINTELMNKVRSYSSSVVAIGSGFTDNTTPAPAETTVPSTTTAKPSTTTAKPSTEAPATTPAPSYTSVIYCSPTGTGSGASTKDPANVLDAVKNVQAGGVIYLMEGTYKYSSPIIIDQNNSGKAGAYKTIAAYNGAKVVFDFSGEAVSGTNRGFVLDGSYWHFSNFEVTKAGDNGMLLSGNNNIIEMMVFNDNQDTGLQISRYRTSAATIAEWPTNNLVLNCTSKNNCDDATMENADGFAAKLTCGTGNVFDGCMAYNNSDDGWDLFAKAETGPIGVVTIKNSIAFRNGFTEFGEGYGDCDGNGFKLGGSGIGSAHIVENCLAFENLHCGFTDNNNPKLGSLTNCTSVNNNMEGTGKPNFSLYRCTDDGCDFKNMMSVYDASITLSDAKLKAAASNDKYVGTYENGVYYNSGYYQVTAKTDVTNGAKIGTKLSSAPAAADFISYAKAPVQGTNFHTVWRNPDGTLNPGGLYETADNSKYSTMGYHMAGYTPTEPQPSSTTVPASTTTASPGTTVAPATDTPAPAGGYIHNFTANGTSSNFYTISGTLSTGKGTVQYAGQTLTQCLKMESATSISFNAPSSGDLTLVFAEPSVRVKIDGTAQTIGADGILKVSLSAGAHTITKGDTANLFYMAFSGASAPSTSVTTKTTTVPSTTTTVATTTAPIDHILYGDASCDGSVNVADVIKVSKSVMGADTLSAEGRVNSDVDRNGVINSDDAGWIIKSLVQIVTLPVA